MKELDILDVLVMVILITVFVPIGMKIYNMQISAYDTRNEYTLSDKNVRQRDYNTGSLEINGGGEFDSWDVLLCSQIQNYYMPQPKSISLGTEDGDGNIYANIPMDVSSVVEEERDVFITQMNDMFKRIGGYQTVTVERAGGSSTTATVPARFILKFRANTSISSDTDDYYMFTKIE